VSEHRANPGIPPLPSRDETAALASAGGDADLAAELFGALLEGLPAEIEDLRACLEESDWPGLAEHAHQVRGATRYCGVPALDEAIEALERAAKIGDPILIREGFARVEAEARRLRDKTSGSDEPPQPDP
jgi:HPt (histidine-containing phosphotransfer) domain-containing protein